MVDRLKLENLKRLMNYLDCHIDSKNFDGAVVVMVSALKQLVSVLDGEELDEQKDPHINIFTKKIDIGNILDVCASVFDVTLDEITSKNRCQSVALARMTAMYYARKQNFKVQDLAKIFDRNHSNITHATKKIGDYLECDPEIAEKVTKVGELLNAC
jgi:chromosomal replication initiation ATPase DnaA